MEGTEQVSLFTNIPRTTKYGFKYRDVHIGVWALQRFLNRIGKGPLAEDGVFGRGTENAIKDYQRAVGATVDGIVGPETQARIVRSLIVRAPNGDLIPKGLLEGQINAESGRLLAAVNWSVPGGVDVGLTQRRVYGPPFDTDKVIAAFDPQANVDRAAIDLYARYLTYRRRAPQHAREYSWRLAALAHNWPYAAELLSKGGTLSTTKRATWAPAGTKFADGSPVLSYRDWAEFYALGSAKHRHAGLVTGLAFGVPR